MLVRTASVSHTSLLPADSVTLPQHHVQILLTKNKFDAGRNIAHFRIEYIPSENVTSTVHKQFDVSFTCVKPLNISYSVSPFQEAQNGLPRDAYGNTVALGDSVLVLGTIQNLQSVPLRIEGVRFAQASANAQNFQIVSDEDLLRGSPGTNPTPRYTHMRKMSLLFMHESRALS